MIVEEIVSKVIQRALHIKCCDLSNEYDGCREDESRREVRVDRAKIRTKPIPFWYKDEPVEYETEEIAKEYDYDKSPEEPHISVCYPLVSDESCRICEDTRYDIESEGTELWHLIGTDSHIEKSYK